MHIVRDGFFFWLIFEWPTLRADACRKAQRFCQIGRNSRALWAIVSVYDLSGSCAYSPPEGCKHLGQTGIDATTAMFEVICHCIDASRQAQRSSSFFIVTRYVSSADRVLTVATFLKIRPLGPVNPSCSDPFTVIR